MNGQVPPAEPGPAKGDDHATQPGWADIVDGLLIALGTILITIVTDPPEGTAGWILVVVGALIVGVAGAGLLKIIRPYLRKFVRWLVKPLRRLVPTLLVAALAAGLIWSVGRIAVLFDRCAAPAQVQALTTPELLAPYRALANQYEDHAAEADGGCRPVEVHVSAMPAARAVEGMSTDWAEEYLREAPRPDIWLAESRTHVEKVQTTGEIIRSGPRMEVTDSIGMTPIVLAVPASSRIDPKAPEWTGQTFSTLVTRLRAAGIGLVRPGTSTVNEFATVAMYASEGGAVQLRSDPGRARAIESWIDSSLKAGQYPPSGDASALLRRQRELGASGAAMVLAELDLIRYNQGVRQAARGRGCGARNGPPECMLAVYPVDTHSLDLPVVLMYWAGNERSAGQQEQAVAFKTWLAGKADGEGQSAMVDQRLRPLPGTPLHEPLSEDNGILQGGPTAHATGKLTGPPPSVREEMIGIQKAVRKTERVLISLDASGSMNSRVGDASRYQRAVQAIRDAYENLRKRAEVSLTVFSATIGIRQVDLGSIEQVKPAGNTPQHRALLDGMRAVGQGGVLVLLTDGNNNVNDVTAQQIAEQSGARVLVLAFGEANCRTQVLIDVTTRTGGACRQAGVETLPADLADLLGEV